MSRDVYLDHASSAPMLPEVEAYLTDLYRQKLGNPASIHRAGVAASLLLERSRQILGEKMNLGDGELVFTSGATEANNFVFNAAAKMATPTRNEVVVCSTEHNSVLQAAEGFCRPACKIIQLPVQGDGIIDLSLLERSISEKTLLVSVSHANNEIGVIQEIGEISKICKKRGALLHSDGAQAFCKAPIDFSGMEIDFYSLSAHKIHGPKGIGALALRRGLKPQSLLFGGSQESGLRAGTVPVELCAAFAKASEVYASSRVLSLRNVLLEKLKSEFVDISFNGSLSKRLCNNVNFSLPGHGGKQIMQKLDSLGIRVSTGSACNAGKTAASHVLLALGQTTEQALGAVRVSLGLSTDLEDIDYFVEALRKVINVK